MLRRMMQKVGEPIEVYVSEMAYGLVLKKCCSFLEIWTSLSVKWCFHLSGEMLHCFQIVLLVMRVIVKRPFAGWLIIV